VFAIGNPFGLDQTLTTGVVSALGREIKSPTEQIISGVIQTDAAINPGNSGGPLLDSAGRLIGVNTAIFSPSGAYAGIGFAIPVDTVNEIVPQLIRRGRAARPDTGITFVEDRQAQSLGVRNGVLIAKVRGAAAEAGLKPTRRVPGGIVLGDIIVAIDGKPVRNRLELERALAKAKVGDTITLTVVRNQDRVDVPLTLREG
jgi:S1-C subfamily serine protease